MQLGLLAVRFTVMVANLYLWEIRRLKNMLDALGFNPAVRLVPPPSGPSSWPDVMTLMPTQRKALSYPDVMSFTGGDEESNASKFLGRHLFA